MDLFVPCIFFYVRMEERISLNYTSGTEETEN